MPKPFAIGVDVDDFLGPLSDQAHQIMVSVSGRAIPIDDGHDFQPNLLYGLTVDDFKGLIIEHQSLSKKAPYPDTTAALGAIREGGHKIVLITARAYHPDAERITPEWRRKHNLPFGQFMVVPEGQSKGSFVLSDYPGGFLFFVYEHRKDLLGGKTTSKSFLVSLGKCFLRFLQ